MMQLFDVDTNLLPAYVNVCNKVVWWVALMWALFLSNFVWLQANPA